jgi:hypothetical protein
VGRVKLLDGLRGACLILMTITHLHFGREYLVGYMHIKQLGFADSAQGFIFLSGLLVGLVGMRQYGREGMAPVRKRYWWRAAELYGWHLALLLVILLASRLLPFGWVAWRDWLQQLFGDGGAYAIAAAGLLYQPTYLDILPQYMLYILAAPLAIRLVAEGRTGIALAVTLGLWLVAQAGLLATPVAWLDRAIVIGGTDITLRAAFNPLGWQLAFFSGLIIGCLLQGGAVRTEEIFPRRSPALAQLAFGLLVACMVLRLALTFGLLDEHSIGQLAGVERRSDLGLLPTLNFAALAYLIGWLVSAAPHAEDGRLRRLSRMLRDLLGHPWLMMLGRHSLMVFVYHVLMIYMLRWLDARLGGIPDPWFSLMALGAIASLFLVAALLDSRRSAAPRPTAVPATAQA